MRRGHNVHFSGAFDVDVESVGAVLDAATPIQMNTGENNEPRYDINSTYWFGEG